MNTDEKYINQTIELALKAKGQVSPNPLVGSVVVKDGEVLGAGYHKKYGGDHAEVDALKNCPDDVEGATLYCNLEPCCHTNKQTPPCTELIIKKKIKKVVIANLDPNPHVAGNGVKKLEDAGIEVVTGVLADKAKNLNQSFFKYIQTKHPYFILKMAQTIDGKIYLGADESQWISDSDARAEVHELRSGLDAILVGAGTVKVDNPKLTVRMNGGERAIKRIILGASFENFSDYHVFTDEFAGQTICVLSSQELSSLNETQKKHLDSNAVTLLEINKAGSEYDLNDLQTKLGEMAICSVLIEGGADTARRFLEAEIVDLVRIYVAPVFALKGLGLPSSTGQIPYKMKELREVEVRKLNKQAVIEGKFNVYGHC